MRAGRFFSLMILLAVGAAGVWRVGFYSTVAAGPIIDSVVSHFMGPSHTEANLRATCQNNLKQMGLVCKMFSNEGKGNFFPALNPQAGHIFFANETPGLSVVYPEFLTDLSVLICPDDKKGALLLRQPDYQKNIALIDDHSYFYLGYVVLGNDDVKNFAEVYKDRIAKGLKFDEDLETPHGKICRLREGVERLYINNPNTPGASARTQSIIPVLIERPDNHTPKGGNILFMDGHVEFKRYFDSPDNFPMNRVTIDTLNALSAMKTSTPPAK